MMSFDPLSTKQEEVEQVVRAVRLLFEGEDACLAAQGSSILGEVAGNSLARTKRSAARNLAEVWTDRLVALRFAADDRTIPLFGENDTNIILDMIQAAGELDPTFTVELRHALDVTLHCFSMGIIIIGGNDEYAGLEECIDAMTDIAFTQGVDPVDILNPENALEAVEFRTAVFEHCMTPLHWQLFSHFRVNLLEGGDEGTTLVEIRAQLAQLSRDYFAMRGREIWSDYNG